MRAGTLQLLHDDQAGRKSSPGRAGACVRGPLVAESCVTGRSLNFPPGGRQCSDLAVRLLSKAKPADSSRLPPAVHITRAHLFTTLPAPQTKDFARIFANLLQTKMVRADLKGLRPSLAWEDTDTHCTGCSAGREILDGFKGRDRPLRKDSLFNEFCSKPNI